jgi:hypothetical protein
MKRRVSESVRVRNTATIGVGYAAKTTIPATTSLPNVLIKLSISCSEKTPVYAPPDARESVTHHWTRIQGEE